MTVQLNHTIVPAIDKEETARFYKQMFGFEYQGSMGHFAPVKISGQSLTLDFEDRESFEPQHYAFKVSEAEFDKILPVSWSEASPTEVDRVLQRTCRRTIGMEDVEFTFAIRAAISSNS